MTGTVVWFGGGLAGSPVRSTRREPFHRFDVRFFRPTLRIVNRLGAEKTNEYWLRTFDYI